MAKFVFAALAVTAIIWGTSAVASWHSQPEQLTMADTWADLQAGRSRNPAQLPHVVDQVSAATVCGFSRNRTSWHGEPATAI